MALLQQVLAGPLPAVGGQHPAERAGVAMGHPRPLRTVPDGIAGGGVGTGLLDHAGNAALQAARAVLRGLDHAGHLAVGGGGSRFCGGQGDPLSLGQGVVHLAGQLCAALAVLGHKGVGVADEGVGVGFRVLVHVLPHELSGLLVQPGEPGNVIIPRRLCQFHLPSPSTPVHPAPAAPAP